MGCEIRAGCSSSSTGRTLSTSFLREQKSSQSLAAKFARFVARGRKAKASPTLTQPRLALVHGSHGVAKRGEAMHGVYWDRRTEWRTAAADPSSLQAAPVRGESHAPGQFLSEVSGFTRTCFAPPDRADLRVEGRSSARPGNEVSSDQAGQIGRSDRSSFLKVCRSGTVLKACSTSPASLVCYVQSSGLGSVMA